MSHEKSYSNARNIVRIVGLSIFGLGSLGLLAAGETYAVANGNHQDCISKPSTAVCNPGYTYKEGIDRVRDFAVVDGVVTITGLAIFLSGIDGNPVGPSPGREPVPGDGIVVPLTDRREIEQINSLPQLGDRAA